MIDFNLTEIKKIFIDDKLNEFTNLFLINIIKYIFHFVL